MDRKEEILAVVKKYKLFFDEWHSDVAIGITGPSFFYVINDAYDELEEFCAFDTADELEAIILNFNAGELETYVYGSAETRLKALDYDRVNELYGRDIPDGSLDTLMKQLSAVADENARWAEKMEKIYKALAVAAGDIASRQKKGDGI